MPPAGARNGAEDVGGHGLPLTVAATAADSGLLPLYSTKKELGQETRTANATMSSMLGYL